MAEKPNPPEEKNSSHNLCLFSLRIDRVAFEKIPVDALDDILTLLKQRGARIINVENTEVNATFQTFKTCTETSKTIIQNILQNAEEFNRATHFVKIGLHIVEETHLEGEQILKYFDVSIAACNSADPNEIIITTELYNHLSTEVQNTCKRRIGSTDINNPFYSLSQKNLNEESTQIISIIPSGKPAPDQLPCFYCGSTLHTAAGCPSKPIQESTDYLNKLGYVQIGRAHV